MNRNLQFIQSNNTIKNFWWDLLSLALFAILESILQSMKCLVSIKLLTVVSHQSNPHHLRQRNGKIIVHQNLGWMYTSLNNKMHVFWIAYQLYLQHFFKLHYFSDPKKYCRCRELWATTYHSNWRSQTSSHLHLMVLHNVGKHLPPVVAIRNCNCSNRRKPQILQGTCITY